MNTLSPKQNPDEGAVMVGHAPLTTAEIDALRQSKRAIADFVQTAFPDREALRRVCKPGGGEKPGLGQ